MKLFVLTFWAMCAFAANSVLNRFAVVESETSPLGFGIVRIFAGALMLCLILSVTRPMKMPSMKVRNTSGAACLALYVFGFSYAYAGVDAGLGALILFGTVQLAMMLFAVLTGQSLTKSALIGMAMAFSGLVLVLWPSASLHWETFSIAAMILAGFGWAGYSILGRGAPDPMMDTSLNFMLCVPLSALLLVVVEPQIDLFGTVLAVISGALTSGLGYALWYFVLPQLRVQTAALVQLSVPIIAMVGGIAFLGESLTQRLVIAACLVLGGIAYSLSGQRSAR